MKIMKNRLKQMKIMKIIKIDENRYKIDENR